MNHLVSGIRRTMFRGKKETVFNSHVSMEDRVNKYNIVELLTPEFQEISKRYSLGKIKRVKQNDDIIFALDENTGVIPSVQCIEKLNLDVKSSNKLDFLKYAFFPIEKAIRLRDTVYINKPERIFKVENGAESIVLIFSKKGVIAIDLEVYRILNTLGYSVRLDGATEFSMYTIVNDKGNALAGAGLSRSVNREYLNNCYRDILENYL